MKKLTALLLALICVLVGSAAYAADAVDSAKTVTKLEIGSLPNKTAYVVGDEFTMEGGTVIVNYDDGTTDELSMNATGLTVKEPGMNASGTKTVTLKVGRKSARFTVEVANNSFFVTFDENYESAPAPEMFEVVKGQTIDEVTPVRDGYTFIAWYVNQDYTAKFDFDTEITEDVNLFALWLQADAAQADITFDYGYYGLAMASYTYPVNAGTLVNMPAVTPVRVGYTFDTWLDPSGNVFDFSKPVEEDTTITASWLKDVNGVQHWVFEAEDTNLSGKTGPAVSGTANETGMILLKEGQNCSNDRCVGYLYKFGNSLEFYFASDMAVEDATIAISLSAEMDNLSIDSSNFGIYLNGEKLAYEQIVIDNVPPFDPVMFVAPSPDFKRFIIATNINLQEGANLVKLMTENNEEYPGTTMLAHAPLVDALMIDTQAVLIWDENHGVPALDNYKH